MFERFKGQIDTSKFNFKKKATIFLSPIEIEKEIFEFSKEDILFSSNQKKRLENVILLHVTPVQMYSYSFTNGTKYKLIRDHINGEIVYKIEIFGFKMPLKLTWINRKKIEWVHGRKINWTIWQVTVTIIAVIVAGTVGYCNHNKNTSPQTTTDTLTKSKANQLPYHGVDTTKKSDSIRNLK
jgi:hypothetical protein